MNCFQQLVVLLGHNHILPIIIYLIQRQTMENKELLQQVMSKAQAWLDGNYNEETKAEIRRMMDAADKTELIESFY